MSFDPYKSNDDEENKVRKFSEKGHDKESIINTKECVCSLFGAIKDAFFKEKDNAKVLQIMSQALEELPQQSEIAEYNEFMKFSIDYVICSLLYTKEANAEEINSIVLFFIERVVKEAYLMQSDKLSVVLFMTLRRVINSECCFDASFHVILMILSFNESIRSRFFSYVRLDTIIDILIHKDMHEDVLYVMLRAAPVANRENQGLIINHVISLLENQGEDESNTEKILNILSSIVYDPLLLSSRLMVLRPFVMSHLSNASSLAFLAQMFEKNFYSIDIETIDEIVKIMESSDPSSIVVCEAIKTLHSIVKRHTHFINDIEEKGIFNVIISVYPECATKTKIALSGFLNFVINHSLKKNLEQFLESDIVDILFDFLASGEEFDINNTLSSIVAILNAMPHDISASILDDSYNQNILDDMLNMENDDVKFKVETIRSFIE